MSTHSCVSRPLLYKIQQLTVRGKSQGTEVYLGGLEGIFTLLLAGQLAGSLAGLDGSLCLAGLALLAQKVLTALQLQVDLAGKLWRWEWRVFLLLHLFPGQQQSATLLVWHCMDGQSSGLQLASVCQQSNDKVLSMLAFCTPKQVSYLLSNVANLRVYRVTFDHTPTEHKAPLFHVLQH